MDAQTELLEGIRDRLLKLIQITSMPDLKVEYQRMFNKIALHIGVRLKFEQRKV